MQYRNLWTNRRGKADGNLFLVTVMLSEYVNRTSQDTNPCLLYGKYNKIG